MTCSDVTNFAPSSIATSPDALTSPPRSLNFRVKESFLPALLFASIIISSNASGLNCGILHRF